LREKIQGATMADTHTEGAQSEQAKAAERVRRQVEDALELSRYVIATGLTDKDGKPLAFADIATIQGAAAALGLLDVAPGPAGAAPAAPGTIDTAAWNAFEQAYYRLAIATHPVTAETLRNTRYAAGAGATGAEFLAGRIREASPAQRFTWKLWAFTICFAAFVLLTEAGVNWLGESGDLNGFWKVFRDLLQALQPWAYGGLGACAFLLRSGHYYIYARAFDLRRTPEYYNRILLGALSGGAIILFADYLTSQEDSVSHIGSTALGFIAGYSNDFLFNTVERVVAAFFPKVQVENVKRDEDKKVAPPPASEDSGKTDQQKKS
jgi:hypothetical protein